MPISTETFEQIALEDDVRWELVRGRLRQKPGGTVEHNSAMSRLAFLLARPLLDERFRVRSNAGYVRPSPDTYFCPDAMVIPDAYSEQLRGTMRLEAYDQPLPFVAEVWSRSTGAYDVDTKFPEYRQRGDREIWRIHRSEKTLIAWRRQPDGSYSESHYDGGVVAVESLPGVMIGLEALFR